MFGLPDYVRYIKEFVKSRFVISKFYSIYFFVIFYSIYLFVISRTSLNRGSLNGSSTLLNIPKKKQCYAWKLIPTLNALVNMSGNGC